MIFGNEILKSALVKGKLPSTTSFRMGAICKKTSICKMASLNARCFNLLVLHFEHFCVERPQRKCRSSKRPGLPEAKDIPTSYVCISNYFEYFRMGTIFLNMSIIIWFSNENIWKLWVNWGTEKCFNLLALWNHLGENNQNIITRK